MKDIKDVSLSGKTKVCGIIGDPVEHSISPEMHNAAFAETGLDYVYAPFRVEKDELGEAIAGMRALNIRGLNVTIPHKVDVIPFLDGLDPLAEKIGAINTIVSDDGFLKGYNTDGSGFLRSLREQGIETEGKEVVILGAGGASRAICFALSENGADLIIINRASGLERARQMAENIAAGSGNKAEVLALEENNLRSVLENADILVNATSVGMSPDIDKSPVPAHLFGKSLVVFDIVYNPLKTRLLKEAEAAGEAIIGGLDMLVWQGAMAFELWTGVKAPVELMKKVGVEALQRHEE